QMLSACPLSSDLFAASATLRASVACSPVPCSAARPSSTQEPKYSISGPHGSALSTSTVDGSPPAPAKRRGPRTENQATMFPSAPRGAAEKAYWATPTSHSTLIELEKGYERGMSMLPSAIPEALAYSTTACTWPAVGSLA